MSHYSVFELIGMRYLDTTHSDLEIRTYEKCLNEKGVKGIIRLLLEYITASALWWNIFRWEWEILDEADVVIGWLFNIVFFSIPAGGVSIWAGWEGYFYMFFALHAVSLFIALGLRQGSVRKE